MPEPETRRAAAERIARWLVDGAEGARTSPEILRRVAEDFRAAGLPLERAEAFVRTLHPHIAGRSFVWRPGEAVVVLERSWAFLRSPEFLASTVAQVFATGEPARRSLVDAPALARAPASERESVEGLARDGYTDLFVIPLRFLSGEVHAIAFCTRSVTGFSDEDLAALGSIVGPMSRIAEIMALSRTAANLLNTYVGHNAGERILAGRIQRGDVDSIRAVLWFSDLRGFTAMAGEVPPGALIRSLNELFECQVVAIEEHGGEVLKFMGDGLLAIFPLRPSHPPDGGGPPGAPDPSSEAEDRASCERSLEAAASAFARMAAQNRVRHAAGQSPLRFGLALHVGEVAYGNIGGAGRLDFTCIGPAVNLASRLEGLASRLGRELVVSDAFQRLCGRPMEPLGEFELKGVARPEPAWAPLAPDASPGAQP